MFKLSEFCISTPVENALILKSNFTGGVLMLSNESWLNIVDWLKNQEREIDPSVLSELTENGFLVDSRLDEFFEWKELMLETRNDKAHVFTLHFEPTIKCQLECSYCFENGADRGSAMKSETVTRSIEWFGEYLDANPEVDSLRLKFFGGEPLLHKAIIAQALEGYKEICAAHHVDFWVELTTNGELLDGTIAELLSRYNWKRVQITLDGPADIHDGRRHGRNGRPTFANIMSNIDMLLENDYIPKVDIRMTLDVGTKDHLCRLIDHLKVKGKQDRINLTLGLTTPSLSVIPGRMTQEELGASALAIWKYAQESGFRIPDEFIAGPLCVAVAKHSAVLQPDGNL